MKSLYIKPETRMHIMMPESSILTTLSGGKVKPEASDSDLGDDSDIVNGGNGDNEDAAKKFTFNEWSTWD